MYIAVESSAINKKKYVFEFEKNFETLIRFDSLSIDCTNVLIKDLLHFL